MLAALAKAERGRGGIFCGVENQESVGKISGTEDADS